MDTSLLPSCEQVTSFLPGRCFLTDKVRWEDKIISKSPFSSRALSSPSEAQGELIALSVPHSMVVAGLGSQLTQK